MLPGAQQQSNRNGIAVIPSPDAISPMLQARNRLGLLLPVQQQEPVPDTNSPGAQTPNAPRNKQGSPFYAEPADALGNVIRRSTRSTPLSSSHRHSEPAKGALRISTGGPIVTAPFCQILSPIESEKSTVAGSLDELKVSNQRKARGRLDPWPLDSSWEFMGIDGEDNDYDTDANWKTGAQLHGVTKSATTDAIQRLQKQPQSPPQFVNKKPDGQDTVSRARQPLTVHQIILKRMPELNLPELMKSVESTEFSSQNGSGLLSVKWNRMSSYDNVEKGHSGYASSLVCQASSAHSDDGTVFSEPWDSSQWDSFLPNDGRFSIN